MTNPRDKLYQKFGPILLEAMINYIFENINNLREKANLEQLTETQILNEIEKKTTELTDYQWIKNDIPETGMK